MKPTKASYFQCDQMWQIKKSMAFYESFTVFVKISTLRFMLLGKFSLLPCYIAGHKYPCLLAQGKKPEYRAVVVAQ